ncbi:10499_t:CDS:2 [Ambispora leptoticha]|uniref:10499_t:CDS:1 n=1 Tax=Ambispora leptoticha TaxID=144679 RepID=A0A9N9F2M8_9GLOM|nr:10499_t:CDS:2 [Ambispora leptoticha]
MSDIKKDIDIDTTTAAVDNNVGDIQLSPPLSTSPLPIQTHYKAEESSNVDDIFNHIMSDIELLQQEQNAAICNDTEIPPLETIHKVLEEQDDLPTKYHLLMREYTSLRRKSSSLFTTTEETKILEPSQIIEDPPKISPLQPANFHVFSTKDYILFMAFIFVCLFSVMMLGFHAVCEMKYNYENNNSPLILMGSPLVEAGALVPAAKDAEHHKEVSKVNYGAEVYYPIPSLRKNTQETRNGCSLDSAHAYVIRTTVPNADKHKCYSFLFFHFCTGKSGNENSWFSS